MLVSHVMLWVVVLLLTVAMLALVRQVGMMNRRIQPWGARVTPLGPQIGQEAPSFDVADVEGRMVRIGGGPKRTLLVFLSPSCTSCAGVAPAVQSIARSERGWIQTIVVNNGSREEVVAFSERNGIAHLPTVISEEIKNAFQANATPYAYLIGRDGRVAAKGIVNSFEHLDSIVRAAEVGVDSLETLAEEREGAREVQEHAKS